MASNELPPPYSDVPKQPPQPQYPPITPPQLQYPTTTPPQPQYPTATGYASPFSPTFEPPYMSAPSAPHPQPHGTSTTVTIQPGGRGPFVPGSCPVCGNTSWTGTYSCFAWFLCIFCFWNFGLCCCLCMRKKKCTKCGFTLN